MKILFLVRHAKSSRDDPGLSDKERPLNDRGRRDAPKMGGRLAKQARRRRDFDEFNRVYAEFFPGDKPSRSTLQAKNMVGTKIEIEAIAYKD